MNLLKNFKLITEAELLEYKKIFQNGFNVHIRGKATYDNIEEKEKIAQYLIRQPIGENRIEHYDEENGKVSIRYKVEIDSETGKTIYKIENMSVYDFISLRIQHILPHHMQSVRFYGIYSNKFRGQHKKLFR